MDFVSQWLLYLTAYLAGSVLAWVRRSGEPAKKRLSRTCRARMR